MTTTPIEEAIKAVLAGAQPAAPGTPFDRPLLSTAEIDGRILCVQGQRDAALNQIVLLSGQNSLLRAELEAAKKQLTENLAALTAAKQAVTSLSDELDALKEATQPPPEEPVVLADDDVPF